MQVAENLWEIKIRKIFLEILSRKINLFSKTTKADVKARQWLQFCLEYKISAIEYMWLEKIFICVSLSCFSVQIWFLKKKKEKNINFQREQLCLSEKTWISFHLRCLKINGITKSYLVSLKTQGLLSKQLIIQYPDR